MTEKTQIAGIDANQHKNVKPEDNAMITCRRTLLLRISLLGFVVSAAMGEDKTTGSITGKVFFDGIPSERLRVNTNLDSYCAKLAGQTPLISETLVVSQKDELANVVVIVKGDSFKDAKYTSPTQLPVLELTGCQYSPHAIVVQIGQSLRLINNDDTTHTVHSLPNTQMGLQLGLSPCSKKMRQTIENVPRMNPGFMTRLQKGTIRDIQLRKEEIFRLRCDAHLWEGAWCYVVQHPFWSVTDKEGRYAIKGLSPGEYEVQYFHEGTLFATKTIKVQDGQTAVEEIRFAPIQNAPN